MKVPRDRFTVRRLMVTVAIVAMLIGWSIEGERRRHRFQGIHAGHWRLSERGQVGDPPAGSDEEVRAAWMEKRAKVARRHAYNRGMMRKYEFAARYPWLPAAPDPPEPEATP